MPGDNRIVKLKLDIIFKRVFGDPENRDIIASLIAALLDIPQESIKEIEITNSEVVPDEYEKKFSRLDLRLKVDERLVNIEMQVNREPRFEDRSLFYWSKLYAGDLKAGQPYSALRQTICINIINFNLFACDDYHSCFLVKEKDRGTVLTDKFAIHFFELRKLGKKRKDKPMDQWLRLINAETEEELMEIMQTTQIPEITKTVVKLREMSADEKLRDELFREEIRLHNEATALEGALLEGIEKGRATGRAEGKEEGIAEGMEKGMAKQKDSFIKKMRLLGYSEEQIKALLDE